MGLYTRPDSKWWWYRIEGTTTRVSTGVPHTGVTAAQTASLRKQAETQYITAKATQTLKGPHKPTIGFTGYARWYETHVLDHQRGATKACSMLRQLVKHFRRYPSLADVDAKAVQEWTTIRRAQVAPSTVNRELDLLKALIRSAVPTYLPTYPLGDVRKLRQVEQEPRVLTVDEETRLLAVCDGHDRAFVLTALDTLLRLGSLLALQWPQVKLEQRSVVPLNAKVSTGVKPLSTRAYEALRALPAREGYVFAAFWRGVTTDVSAKHHAIRRFDYLCRLAHVPHGRAFDGVTFHSLRHTGASRALQRGASVRTVMELGGWKGHQVVMRYLHVTDADVRAAAESIGRD